jgi:hypothetical protein
MVKKPRVAIIITALIAYTVAVGAMMAAPIKPGGTGIYGKMKVVLSSPQYVGDDKTRACVIETVPNDGLGSAVFIDNCNTSNVGIGVDNSSRQVWVAVPPSAQFTP